jgi:hypothetical protein
MIHVVHNNDQSGPYPEDEIRQKLTSGDFLPTDLAWKEGMEKWEPLSSFFDVPRHKQRLLTKSRILLAGSGITLIAILILTWPHLCDVAAEIIPRKPPLSLDETPLIVEPLPNIDKALVFFRYLEDSLAFPQVVSEDGVFNPKAADDYLTRLQLAREHAQEAGLDQELQGIIQDRETLFPKYLQTLRTLFNVTEDHQIRETQEVTVSSFDSGFKGGQTAAALASGGSSLVASALLGVGVYALDMWLTQTEQAAQRDRAYEERKHPLIEEWRRASMVADTNFRKAAQALTARHNWNSSESGASKPQEHTDAMAEAFGTQNLEKLSSLLRAEREARPRDPFVACLGTTLTLVAKGDTAAAADYAQSEKEALEAVKLLPPDSFYDQFRSELYWLAAYSALEQSKPSKKVTGYLNGPHDSSRAVRLFLAAKQHNPYDSSGHIRWGLGTSYALAGHFDKALALHEEVRGNFAEDPDFQLDLARLYALNGKGQESMATVETLLRIPNFADVSSLRSDDDLQQLQANHRATLEELTALKTQADVEWGWVLDDLILYNNSAFPLTNVRFTPRIQQKGQLYTKELSTAQIAPGSFAKWADEFSVTGSAFESFDYTVVCDQGTATGSVAKQ